MFPPYNRLAPRKIELLLNSSLPLFSVYKPYMDSKKVLFVTTCEQQNTVKFIKPVTFGCYISIQTYDGMVADIKATLVNGYLPDRSYLIKNAEIVAKIMKALPEI
jgi:hypothetical protein